MFQNNQKNSCHFAFPLNSVNEHCALKTDKMSEVTVVIKARSPHAFIICNPHNNEEKWKRPRILFGVCFSTYQQSGTGFPQGKWGKGPGPHFKEGPQIPM